MQAELHNKNLEQQSYQKPKALRERLESGRETEGEQARRLGRGVAEMCCSPKRYCPHSSTALCIASTTWWSYRLQYTRILCSCTLSEWRQRGMPLLPASCRMDQKILSLMPPADALCADAASAAQTDDDSTAQVLLLFVRADVAAHLDTCSRCSNRI